MEENIFRMDPGKEYMTPIPNPEINGKKKELFTSDILKSEDAKHDMEVIKEMLEIEDESPFKVASLEEVALVAAMSKHKDFVKEAVVTNKLYEGPKPLYFQTKQAVFKVISEAEVNEKYADMLNNFVRPYAQAYYVKYVMKILRQTKYLNNNPPDASASRKRRHNRDNLLKGDFSQFLTEYNLETIRRAFDTSSNLYKLHEARFKANTPKRANGPYHMHPYVDYPEGILNSRHAKHDTKVFKKKYGVTEDDDFGPLKLIDLVFLAAMSQNEHFVDKIQVTHSHYHPTQLHWKTRQIFDECVAEILSGTSVHEDLLRELVSPYIERFYENTVAELEHKSSILEQDPLAEKAYNRRKNLRLRFSQKSYFALYTNEQKEEINRICSRTGKRKSIRETEIGTMLAEWNVPYRTQYIFKDLKDTRYLPFDFAVISQNRVAGVIEYDGEYHFEVRQGQTTKKDLKIQCKHDSMKNRYCKKNGIPILRINYMQSIEEQNLLVHEFCRKVTS